MSLKCSGFVRGFRFRVQVLEQIVSAVLLVRFKQSNVKIAGVHTSVQSERACPY